LNLTSDEREAILLHMHGDAPQMQTNSLARLVWKADKVSAAGKAKLN
jgi:CTP:molybdopterin cytidylyltransferase MocA